jgi:GTP cyclohydrolase I
VEDELDPEQYVDETPKRVKSAVRELVDVVRRNIHAKDEQVLEQHEDEIPSLTHVELFGNTLNWN